MAENFPNLLDTRSLRIVVDDGFNWIVADYGEAVEIMFLPLLKMLIAMEKFLQWLPWYVVLIVLTMLTFIACRNVKVTVGTADRKSTRLNSSHVSESRMPSSA